MNKLFLLISLVLVLVPELRAQTTAFVRVNVIPMDRERVLTNQTVIVRNGLTPRSATPEK